MSRSLRSAQTLYRLAFAVLAITLLLASGPSLAERRIALVIGNSGYADAPLRNPLNDARDMGSTLESFGFTVTRLEDADQNAMKRGIRNFSKELGEGTVGLFYYAGHGIQVDGENYLMPIGADIETETDVVYDAIPLGRVLDSMGRSGGGLNLVILDACRNNPYTRSLRSSSRGLARASPSTSGTMILYATEPGEVAADGAGRNGVFTGELLKVLDEAPELEVEQLFKQATNQVYAKTGGKQSPWSEGVIRGDFSFGQEPVVLEPVAPEPIKPEPVASPQRIEIAELPASQSLESALWTAAQEDNTEDSYQWYLQRFPDGVFAGIASGRMLRLRQAREQQEAQLAAEQARLVEEQRQQAQAQKEAERQAALVEQQRLETIERERNQAARLAEAKAAEKALALSRDWRRGVQVGLNAAGINVGTPDGLWGARTREGIRQWQAEKALPETGYLTGSDYRQLVAEMSVVEVAPPKPVRQAFEPEMLRIKGGSFEMGSLNGGYEHPVRTVSVRAFEMGKYEVTFNQYDAYARSAGVALPSDNGWGRGSRPVINVSWKDAQNYINWLNAKTAGGYRLPSEAEWEYAARAGTTGSWSFTGDESALCNYGNGRSNSCQDGFVNTAPVGNFKSNKNGLYDVHGNVREWTQDCWHENYRGAPTNGSVWIKNGDCGRRVLRGGSWVSKPNDLRSAFRNRSNTSNRNNFTGFRLSRTLTP